MSKRRTQTCQTPAFPEKSRRKDEGGNYGGPRRATNGLSEEPETSPVKEAFERPSSGPWSGQFGGRSSISDIRVGGAQNADGNSRGGWGK